VDHEQLVQRIAKATLQHVGHSVTVLADGRDALSLLASNGNFDAVILDLGLPGISAGRLAAEIQQMRPLLKILPSTGYPEAQAERWLEGVRTAGFLQKPYTAAQLKRAIARALKD
jgi:CheY-like chemotaxis protein